MPKLGMQDLRRRQLIDATFATVQRHGLADTTMQRIAREAGLSAGMIHHYFADKNALLAATMRALLGELRGDVVARMRAARTPQARLRAVLAACFAPAQFRPALVAVWLAFWAQSPHSPELARLRRLYDRRTRSNLLAPLTALLPRAEAEATATTLAAMIDGFWLRAGASEAGLARADALAHVEAYLDLRLAARGASLIAVGASPPDRDRSGGR
ncbi:MAG: choline-responsive transcriptional repressor BetI [Alphaproteobacteria bacterium]